MGEVRGAIAIGTLAQIPPGEGRNIVVGDRTLAVFHLRDGAVYATQPNCPHAGGPLADGLTGGARGARDGVADAAARGARDVADGSSDAATGGALARAERKERGGTYAVLPTALVTNLAAPVAPEF